MMTPALTWIPKPTSRVRVAYASLDRAEQRLLDAVLFEGRTCDGIAGVLGVTASEVRRRVAALLLGLYDQLGAAHRGGAIEAMLALHALDALEPDEAEVIEAMLARQPALRRCHAGYEALLGELCAVVPRIVPSPRILERLSDTVAQLFPVAFDDAVN